MSNNLGLPPDGPEEVPITKGIGSLAQKSSTATTRGGTKKLKFTPTLPVRRTVKTETNEVSKEEKTVVSTSTTRDRGRGRGRGRGGFNTRPSEMTASGPFAMGPSAMSGPSTSRSALRANTTIMPPSGTSSPKIGSALSNIVAPKLQSSKGKVKLEEEETYKEVYSEQEEDGVEIIDMSLVKDMDWSAPDLLNRSTGIDSKVKKELKDGKIKDGEGVQVDPANALDLSESEEEDESEDIHVFFARQQAEIDMDRAQSRKSYFFQFPAPFPTFKTEISSTPLEKAIDGNSKISEKHVSFSADTKPAVMTGDYEDTKGMDKTAPNSINSNLSGQIGNLEIYESGVVKIRLGDNILYDVMTAMPSSFLQQAVRVDPSVNRMSCLGEVNQRFVVSPNVEQILEAVERSRLTNTSEMEIDG